MYITKKSIKFESVLLCISVLLSGSAVLINPISTHALSLREVANSLPVIGSGEETDKPEDKPAASTKPTKPVSTPSTPEVTPIPTVPVVPTPVVEPPKPTPQTQPTPPVVTPPPVQNPPVATKPVTTKPVTSTPTSPTVKKSPTAVKPQPAATRVNVRPAYQEAPIIVTPAVATPSIITPVVADASIQARQFALAQASRDDIMPKYTTSQISPERRNELLRISAGIALVGIVLYLFTVKQVIAWTLGESSRKTLTVNN